MTMLRLPLLVLLGLLAVGGFLTGCSTPESAENESERPWSAPRSWEHGLPGFMNEGR
jgi:hypothetical protein